MATSNANEEINAAKNLELAIALVEEDNVDELETTGCIKKKVYSWKILAKLTSA